MKEQKESFSSDHITLYSWTNSFTSKVQNFIGCFWFEEFSADVTFVQVLRDSNQAEPAEEKPSARVVAIRQRASAGSFSVLCWGQTFLSCL